MFLYQMLQNMLGIKMKAVGGKTAVIPNLGCRQNEWTAVSSHKHPLCTHNRMLGQPQS